MEKSNQPLETIVIAALLHDIGKLGQRAAKGMEELPENIRNQIQDLCPQQKGGYYSHLHVLWTLDFFENQANFLRTGVANISISGEETDTLVNLASCHHAPNVTPHQEIIKQADWLSAGQDRVQYHDQEEENGKRAPFRQQKLISPFALLALTEGDKKQRSFMPLIPLTTTEACFPHPDSLDKDLTSDYKQLYDSFCRDFQKIPGDHYVARLLALLEYYTWTVPSSTIDQPDISLFDHAKTTAAFAQALYLYHKQTGTLSNEAIRDWETKKFLLLSGDLSGIQKFIFRLKLAGVRGVNKLLRARSFYLQMLTEAVLYHISKTLGLFEVARIMDAGGRFLLLLPNLPEVKETLTRLREELDSWFFHRFAGELALNLNWEVEANGNDFKQKNFQQLLARLAEQTDQQKKRKFSAYLHTDGKWALNRFLLEQDFADLKDHDRCEACGIYPGSQTVEEFNQIRHICPHCLEEQKLGKWLLDTRYLCITADGNLSGQKIRVLDRYWIHFLKDFSRSDPRLFETISTTEFLGNEPSFPRHLIANHVPCFQKGDEKLYEKLREEDEEELLILERERQKTFHHLAKLGTLDAKTLEEVGGQAMLGVFKADVDNLGLLFSDGFGNQSSISRYATLSRLLNHFFVGHLNDLLENGVAGDRRFRDVYTVYSGGDDLLYIGEWKTMIDFAGEIQKRFESFVCNNPDIHLSAGLAMIPDRLPINRGIQQADELLEKSKEQGKNRIGLFETVVSWDKFPKLIEYGRFLDREIQKKDSTVNRGFVYRLLQYHKMYCDFKHRQKIENLIYISHLGYDIARNIVEFDKKTREIKEEFQELYNKLAPLMSTYPEDTWLMENLKIPLFYALYKTRGMKKDRETHHG